jgi:hypothetical protein
MPRISPCFILQGKPSHNCHKNQLDFAIGVNLTPFAVSGELKFMSEQIAGESEANIVKSDGPMPKPPKPSKAVDKAKPDKKKASKTSFSGRIDEVAIGEGDAISFVLKDKRGKRHQFALADASVPRLLLLASALTSKYKCHVETAAGGDRPSARAITLHAKK